MARKAPKGSKPKKRKRKMRLSLKQKKMNTKSDSYTDNIGWSTDVGRTLGEGAENKPKANVPETIKHQCTLCGAIMKVPKPKKARYTITCPHCQHEDSFN